MTKASRGNDPSDDKRCAAEQWRVRLKSGEVVDGRFAYMQAEALGRFSENHPVHALALREFLDGDILLPSRTRSLLESSLLIPRGEEPASDLVAVAKCTLIPDNGEIRLSDPFDRSDPATADVLERLADEMKVNLQRFLGTKAPGRGR